VSEGNPKKYNMELNVITTVLVMRTIIITREATSSCSLGRFGSAHCSSESCGKEI